MESTILLFLLILAALAVLDLMVGVSNDAVNFLNSAVGSKIAPRQWIMAIAAAGIFIGATFSSGMMEVARTGVFNPEHFYFKEVMIIFLAVMLTDVILLDVFNSLGLPTSTTVSIIFELFGASVGIAVLKSMDNPTFPISDYINAASILGIVSGILLSVLFSFVFGASVQYLTRLLFSFDYERRVRRYGSIWAGIAITGITYFLLIKGAKGASFMSEETVNWIQQNTFVLMVISFFVWTILLFLLNRLFRVNILKVVVLAGTFGLAMAFAGNDLVNFIGVPLAGYESYKIMQAIPGATPDNLLMDGLTKQIHTDTLFLILAGIVMVFTLYTSKKAKLVIKTELDLGRQSEGEERWGSSKLARSIVRQMVHWSQAISAWMPEKIKQFIENQFNTAHFEQQRKKLGADAPQFDGLRAAVNLSVASMLIAMGTSLKLPLSTTYVTFMVAMSSSLADRAWGRESAVYRLTGVLSVIGGWFLTAVSAFSITFLMALLIYWGGVTTVVVIFIMALLLIYRTFIQAKQKLSAMTQVSEFEFEEVNGVIEGKIILTKSREKVVELLNNLNDLYGRTLLNFENEDRKLLREVILEVEEVNMRAKKMKAGIYPTVKKLQEEFLDCSLYYVQVIDYLREGAHCLSYLSNPAYDHINNNHKPFMADQISEIRIVREQVQEFMSNITLMIRTNDFRNMDEVIARKNQLIESLQSYRRDQLKRIKKEKTGTKISLLYLNMLHETQNLVLHLFNLLKAQRDMNQQEKSKI